MPPPQASSDDVTTHKPDENKVKAQASSDDTPHKPDKKREKRGKSTKAQEPSDDDDTPYNPYEHRVYLERSTNNWETLAHLLKGCIGSGVLAIPLAVHYGGLGLGTIATLLTGCVLTYCVVLVVRNAERLCVRHRIPKMAIDEVGYYALLYGPERFRKFSKAIKYSINSFLIVDLFGCCTVYAVFSAKNLKQVIDYYTAEADHLTTRQYILILLPFFLLYIMVRPLKILAPLSLIANIMIISGGGISIYYMLTDLPLITDRPFAGDPAKYALFFGIAIFALEGIGVVMPLENNMTTPCCFIHGPGILYIGFGTVIALYTIIGFIGCWKYGYAIQGSLTLNLPQEEPLAQTVKVLFAISMAQTFGLQFYVPFQIIWRSHRDKYGKYNLLVEYCFRWAITIVCVMAAYLVPDIGAVMSLVGAICLSFVGIIFPAVIDFTTCYEDPGLGTMKWRLIVDICLFIFGILGFVFGTICSIEDIRESFASYKET